MIMGSVLKVLESLVFHQHQYIHLSANMSTNKDNSEVKLINSVAGTGALSTQSLFDIKGWVTVGQSLRRMNGRTGAYV